MRSFIIRPFGKKTSLAGQTIDFDAVAKNLLDPAMSAAGLTGRETIDIMEQGNIREDMFQRLLTADVVIADITIQNANVFYELGLRHALRGRVTFLLRGKTDGDAVPFDLKTDRYLSYDTQDPGSCVGALTNGLLASVRSDRSDSPVFQLLPNMVPQNPDNFLAVPIDFHESVDLCAAEGRIAELALMSLEVERMAPEWETLGHRLIGEAMFGVKYFDRSHAAWERVRKQNPTDQQANLRLGTIYQKQGQLRKSEIALQRVELKDQATIAEVESLRGSNSKQLWISEWRDENGTTAQIAALESPWLNASREHYSKAFLADLNHYYSGINALAMTRIQTELAIAQPDTWAGLHPSDQKAALALDTLQETARKMQATLALSLESANDAWAAVTRADLAMLTSDRSRYAIRKYRAALGDQPDQTYDAVLNQFRIFTSLGLLKPMASEIESAIKELSDQRAEAPSAAPRYLIFTGHRVDAKNRKKPRFPNTEGAIKAARTAIEKTLKEEKARYPDVPLIGVCGGACGADLLFHECCDALGIDTWLLLAVPRESYVKSSVLDGGRDWVEKFDAIYDTRRAENRLLVLQDSEDEALPDWLSDMEDYGIWQRNNLWTLSFGMKDGADRASLIALWDGKSADGMGGTLDMITLCEERGVPTTIIPIDTILKKA